MIADQSYDVTLFVEAPNEYFECPLCINILKDPVLFPKGGHTFCRSCVTESLVTSETCPTCRERLTIDSLISNRLINNMIEDLEVKCLSVPFLAEDQVRKSKRMKLGFKEFCEWTGKLNGAESHYNECQFANTTCPNDGFDDILVRREIPDHNKICPHCLMPCKWCKELGKVDKINAHLMVCKACPVPCPNDCFCENGAIFHSTRDEIAHHRTICPEEEMVCKYASSGCNTKLTRRYMTLHEGDARAHIDLLQEAFQDAEEEISQLKSRLIDQKNAAEAVKINFEFRFPVISFLTH
jgi:hypothetical protein